jgi:hypothetical protein
VPRVGGASAALGSSIATAFNLPRWRRATGCLGARVRQNGKVDHDPLPLNDRSVADGGDSGDNEIVLRMIRLSWFDRMCSHILPPL